ncbi:sodium:proton antiporter [Sulfurimonas sp. SAG-AH-194-C20]|nr:Na+/H+ antiporter NhaC family protein [Sulfurimonas sp. SAG-AH-194-C20]MDF1878301.1 sodium:proton antiporter [Sulfurimonas sp. SAG-AH-194-C20]
MLEPTYLSLFPSLLAIFLALYSKNVILSLFSGVVLGTLFLNDFSVVDSLMSIVLLFSGLMQEAWILKTLAFVILAGSIMALIEKSGGVGGFVDFVLNKHSLVKSERSALMLSYILGVVIFIETSITALVSGSVGKPLCDKYKIPHEKLAFVCDSTSAPIGSLIVLNGYGALLLGLISTQISLGYIELNATEMLISALKYNFYAMLALVVTFLFIYFGLNIGPMKNASYKTHSVMQENINIKSMYLMVLPIFLMIVLVFVFLYITGEGNILKGSGSSAIFYTMMSTTAFTLVYYVSTKVMSLKTWTKTAYNGAKSFIPVAFILVFAFAMGNVTGEFKTGVYLSTLASENVSVYFLAGIIFLLSSVISFSTGTSWGTFSIMVPIAVPMAVGMDANIALCIGAVISGGIFGDHCSPISDTTIISSMASDCEVISHVKTQLPYALISGSLAFVMFIVFALLG